MRSEKEIELIKQLLVECGEEPTEENIDGFALNHAGIEDAANGDVEALAALRHNCGLSPI